MKLTAGEELQASKLAGNDLGRMAFELAKCCLIEVNGERLDIANAERDTLWETMDPQIRSFVMQGYGSLHNSDDEASKRFLASRKVRV